MSDNEVSNLGGKMGPRLTKLLADAMIYTRQRLGPHQAGIAQIVLRDFTNHVSDEVRGVMEPMWSQFADDPETPEHLKPLFKALATERGQAWAWIAGSATGAALSGSIGDLFSNLLSPVVQNIVKDFPNALLSPESIAQIIARSIQEDVRDIVPVDEAERGGLSGDRLRYLVELARNYPTVGELLTLLNRKVINKDQFHHATKRMGYDESWRLRMLELAKSDISLGDISAMWNRSVIDANEAVQLGSRIGYDKTQVQHALELGGDPLAPTDLGEAFRRGFINRDRFNRGIVQGPIRNEWFDVLEKLQFHRMTTVDAADAVNQGHIPLDAGKKIAYENGLDPEDFQVLIETAGAPPGIDFATEALNRGFITTEQFRSMFLESRIKNKYMPLLLQMRTRLIPQETARLLYRNGVYSREETLRTLLAHGFSSDDAAALIALEETRQDEGTKELTRAQVAQMYEEQILDLATTKELLTALGYSESNVELMIALADIKRVQKYVNAAISRVRAAYIAGKIDENEASIQLDSLAVPASQRDELMSIWDIDRQTITKTLTAAQIRQAYKRDLITYEDALFRLRSQGYDDVDAGLYLELTA